MRRGGGSHLGAVNGHVADLDRCGTGARCQDPAEPLADRVLMRAGSARSSPIADLVGGDDTEREVVAQEHHVLGAAARDRARNRPGRVAVEAAAGSSSPDPYCRLPGLSRRYAARPEGWVITLDGGFLYGRTFLE